MARPPFRPSAEQRKVVQGMAAIGCTEDEIQQCVPWGQPDDKPIDMKTLRKHFGPELERGHALDGMRVRKRLHDLIDDGNVAAIIFYCKVRLGMKEGITAEITGKDGAPLAQPVAQLYLPLKNEQEPLDPGPYDARRAECRLPLKNVAPEPVQRLTSSPAEPLPWHEPEPAPRVAGSMKTGNVFFPTRADPRR